MNKRLLFLINPKSGTKSKKNLPEAIKKQISFSDFDIKFTEYAGHARDICNAHKDAYDAVVIAGGDGSVNEVVQALAGGETALGILPFGSGNGFANSLGIPQNLAGALKIIETFKVRKIDLGLAENQLFDNVFGLGFDALIAHKFAGVKKRGFASYIKIVVREFRKYKAEEVTIKLDDKPEMLLSPFLLSVANGAEWGNHAKIAPDAVLDDGLLNVTLLKRPPVRALLALGIKLFSGKLHQSNYTENYVCKKIEICKHGDIQAHIDGEPVVFKDKIKISIRPESLPVIVNPEY